MGVDSIADARTARRALQGAIRPASDPARDADLVRRIKRGDPSALGELYDRYVSVLLPVALRILRDGPEAEDVIHDAFISVVERVQQYEPERGAVRVWLTGLVRNLSIDRTRRRGRWTRVAGKLGREPSTRVETPESLAASAADRAKIARALSSLPASHLAILEVAFFEGLSYPEIAERERMPLGTVKSRAARAIAALGEALEREGPRSTKRRDALAARRKPRD
jgi:RNA polymerase sigma-70 factor (ECF subfamily)